MTIISKLDSSKSPGSDNKVDEIYRTNHYYLPLVDIFHKSFATGIVPDRLKAAKVVSMYKKRDRNLPTNYRPISLLSTFDMLLEKVMYKRL